MVHSCPQLKRLGTGFSFPTGSEELKLCRGGLGAEYLSSSAGAETSPLGFGQDWGFGSLFGAGEGLSLPVVSSSAASDGTPGLRAALSHGLRSRKTLWSGFSQDKGKVELFTLLSRTEILSLLPLASCSRDRVVAFHSAVKACCSGEKKEQGWGWWMSGAGRTALTLLLLLQGSGGERWDSASVTLQQGLEQGEGHRVSLTCCYLCQ